MVDILTRKPFLSVILKKKIIYECCRIYSVYMFFTYVLEYEIDFYF